MKTITPRFNFVQLLGLLWIVPFLVLFSIGFTSNAYDILVVLVIATAIVVNLFLLKIKWIRPLIGIGLIVIFVATPLLIYNGFDIEYMRILPKFIFGLSMNCLTIGLFLLIFNIGVAVEFNRTWKQPVDYNITLHKALQNQSYNFKNKIALTTCVGLILIAIFLYLCSNALYQIPNQYFLQDSESIVFIFLTLSALVCGVGFFIKLKIIRYFTLILFISIGFFEFYVNHISLRGHYDVMPYGNMVILVGFSIAGLVFIIILALLLFHPLMTYFFDHTLKSFEDDDNILDLK